MTTTADAATRTGRIGARATGADHEHGWRLESRHRTAQGWVLYVRCAQCGARRIDTQSGVDAVPEPRSIVVAAP